MKKPDHQWRTRLHCARRRDRVPTGPWEHDSRAEAFDLVFADGRRGEAILGLQVQSVCAVGAQDPDLVHAIQCWLAARGQRRHDVDVAGDGTWRGDFEISGLGSPPMHGVSRIVTLAPSNAELVEALGAWDCVVGCEDSSDVAPGRPDFVRVGPDLAPDLACVAGLAPDVVISSLTVPGMERVVTELKARGMAQVVVAPRSIADVVADALCVGRVIGRCEAGKRLATDLRAQQQTLIATKPTVGRRVYLEWWPKPMFSPGASCYSNELIDLAGGTNVFADRPGASVEITAAELVDADPDVCFVSWCGVPQAKLDPSNLIRRRGLASLRAGQSGRVYPIDERYSGRPGPNMLEAARHMRRWMADARAWVA